MQLMIVLQKGVASTTEAQTLVNVVNDYVQQFPGVGLRASVSDNLTPPISASATSAVSPTADDPPDFD